jgi:hypothetical protein
MLKLRKILNRYFKALLLLLKENKAQPIYRVSALLENELGEYIAEVQITNKGHAFRMKPEEILANNEMTDKFSQRDIRTLTYLGYLGINSPQYQILAKHLSTKENKLIFLLKEKGKKSLIAKSAKEISVDETLLKGLKHRDAHMIGFVYANEQIQDEQTEKQKLIANQ